MHHHVIAGGAGFIGLNLAKELLKDNESAVTIIDNHSNSHAGFLHKLLHDHDSEQRLFSIKAELSDYPALSLQLDEALSKETAKLWQDTDMITLWHLAANSDIPSGILNPAIDLRDTFMTTYTLLELCRQKNISQFVFASSSAIYGDHGDTPISENTAPLMPISNYGAMKLASEALCLAALHEFLSTLYIFRFPNVVGVPATHGVIFDFVNKLINCPERLQVLGDGSQRKSYLHVADLVLAMKNLACTPLRNHDSPIFNLGPQSDSITVQQIAEIVVRKMSPDAQIMYGNTSFGWKGDIPRFSYNTDKAHSYGWRPSMSSQDAIELATDQIISSLSLL